MTMLAVSWWYVIGHTVGHKPKVCTQQLLFTHWLTDTQACRAAFLAAEMLFWGFTLLMFIPATVLCGPSLYFWGQYYCVWICINCINCFSCWPHKFRGRGCSNTSTCTKCVCVGSKTDCSDLWEILCCIDHAACMMCIIVHMRLASAKFQCILVFQEWRLKLVD